MHPNRAMCMLLTATYLCRYLTFNTPSLTARRPDSHLDARTSRTFATRRSDPTLPVPVLVNVMLEKAAAYEGLSILFDFDGTIGDTETPAMEVAFWELAPYLVNTRERAYYRPPDQLPKL